MTDTTEERKEDRVVRLRTRALSVFVDTTCSVRCAWAMPVYMSVNLNSGGGRERHLTIHRHYRRTHSHAGTQRGLTTSLLLAFFVLTEQTGVLCTFHFKDVVKLLKALWSRQCA